MDKFRILAYEDSNPQLSMCTKLTQMSFFCIVGHAI